MTDIKAERKQIKRVEKALEWAQVKLKTAFHFSVSVGVLEEEEEDDPDAGHAIMWIDRTARGTDDPTHFSIEIDVEQCASLNTDGIRKMAAHEVIHARLFDLDDLVYENEDADDIKARREIEGVTYWIQRLIVGELKE